MYQPYLIYVSHLADITAYRKYTCAEIFSTTLCNWHKIRSIASNSAKLSVKHIDFKQIVFGFLPFNAADEICLLLKLLQTIAVRKSDTVGENNIITDQC